MDAQAFSDGFGAIAAAAAPPARAAQSSPYILVGCKRGRAGARSCSDVRSCCSLERGLHSLEACAPGAWPECETCGKQDLLHLSCNKCASPVCGDCVGGKCGVCGADLQRAFRGCDLCGRVFRRRGTRMCVHCTETWCFSCIDRMGTCGCGGLTEEGFLRPLELVEAPLPRPGVGGPAGPCLSTASSCNLAVCLADTATSEPAQGGVGPDGQSSCSTCAARDTSLPGAPQQAVLLGTCALAPTPAVAAATAASPAAMRQLSALELTPMASDEHLLVDTGLDDAEDEAQWSSNGGSCL